MWLAFLKPTLHSELLLQETTLSGDGQRDSRKARGWGKLMHHVMLLGVGRESAQRLACESCSGWHQRVGKAMRPLAFAP